MQPPIVPGVFMPTNFTVVKPSTLRLNGNTINFPNGTQLRMNIERFYLNTDFNGAGQNLPKFNPTGEAFASVKSSDGVFGKATFEVDLSKIDAPFGYLRLLPQGLPNGYLPPTITVFDGVGGVLGCHQCPVYPTQNYNQPFVLPGWR
jgi:hypothetical protein